MADLLCIAAMCILSNVSVTDGDTIRSGPLSVRIFGISAPERRDDAGPASTASLREIVDGGPLVCRDTGERTWGRVVAQCWTPAGTDIACEQVRRGHATDWPRFSDGYYARCED